MLEVSVEKSNQVLNCTRWTGATCFWSGCEAWRGIDVQCSAYKSCDCKEGFCNHLLKGACVKEGCWDVEGPSETDETINTCWKHIEWARTTGIKTRPEWYTYNGSNLSSNSPHSTFQKFIYEQHPEHNCPSSCLPRYEVPMPVKKVEKPHHPTCTKSTGGTCARGGCYAWRGIDVECSPFKKCDCKEGFCNHFNKGFCVREGCQDVEGPSETDETLNKCLKHIEWARTTGIKQRPEWYTYNGLSSDSPHSSFQKFIYYEHPEMGCPPPCLARYK
ncbi:unnamed protein product [Polarella glacialis]|uniref:Uncharacterized protein n=1 Tax=Polarella glacialis TaxID=89957 RepID=A0A813FXJ4_POLGL|nr:unnamed protein product [Polarella glacialis]